MLHLLFKSFLLHNSSYNRSFMNGKNHRTSRNNITVFLFNMTRIILASLENMTYNI